MVFHGALREVVSMKGTLCQRRGHAARMAAVCLEVGGWQCGDLQEALGLGKQVVRLLQHGGTI